MKMYFKQRMFSWFDSYDIFDEAGNTIYTVEGKISWGHRLHVLNQYGEHIGTVKQKVFSFMPTFEIYENEQYLGSIHKEFSFIIHEYNVDFKGWNVHGDMFEWDYEIYDENNEVTAIISKELFNWTDTYTIEVKKAEDALYALMLVLAIDAEKCSRE